MFPVLALCGEATSGDKGPVLGVFGVDGACKNAPLLDAADEIAGDSLLEKP